MIATTQLKILLQPARHPNGLLEAALLAAPAQCQALSQVGLHDNTMAKTNLPAYVENFAGLQKGLPRILERLRPAYKAQALHPGTCCGFC